MMHEAKSPFMKGISPPIRLRQASAIRFAPRFSLKALECKASRLLQEVTK
ncbi:MAG TPA: hypothetical protein VME69_14180 [Methylocella sp.]|nr:hypothetical protein [Methylocella sp.]